jgi:hypothetical protein
MRYLSVNYKETSRGPQGLKPLFNRSLECRPEGLLHPKASRITGELPLNPGFLPNTGPDWTVTVVRWSN